MSMTGEVIWSFAFDKLRSSSDDGIRTLFLDFGPDDGEFVSTNFLYQKKKNKNSYLLQMSANNVYFCLYNYNLGTGHGMLPKASSICFAQLSFG